MNGTGLRLYNRIIIIIIIALTSLFPRLHGLDGSPKCYFSKQRDPAHLLVSTSICSYHPPHTPSMFFSLCLFLFSLLPPCFCMPTPSHLPPYVPHARTISISPGALCQTHQLSLVCPLALRSNFHPLESLHTSILSSSSLLSPTAACPLPS